MYSKIILPNCKGGLQKKCYRNFPQRVIPITLILSKKLVTSRGGGGAQTSKLRKGGVTREHYNNQL